MCQSTLDAYPGQVPDKGGGVSLVRYQMGDGGGTPARPQMKVPYPVPTGLPPSSPDRGKYPHRFPMGVHPSSPGGGYPHPILMGGGGAPIQSFFPDRGSPIVPNPFQDSMGVPLGLYMSTLCPYQDWMGVPPHQETEQQSEHLLHGGQYASCVHAGGLSCSLYVCN